MAVMTDAERIELEKYADVETLSTVIPGYWQEHLDEKIKTIHAHQVRAGVTGTSFGLITDVHVGDNSMHSSALMEKVLTECGIPYFFNAGDFVTGMGIITPEDLVGEILLTRRLFNRIADRQLMVLGNHDPAYSTFLPPDYYAESLTKEEIYEYVFRHQMAYGGRVFGEDGTCFYADDTFHKVRYVALNTHDTPSDELKADNKHPVYDKFRLTGFREGQVNWFANVALQVPSVEWSVVLCTHEALGSDKGTTYYNRDLVLGLINAFRKHETYQGSTHYENMEGYDTKVEADFTGKGGDFIAWVGGHEHKDGSALCDGVLTICSINDSLHNSASSPFVHKERTNTEQSFDIFTINKKEHKLYITKIGCGEDRVFDYQVF